MILRKFMFCNSRKLKENIVCKGFSPFWIYSYKNANLQFLLITIENLSINITLR